MLTSDIYFSINLARTLEINPDDQISLTKAFLHNKSQITTVLTANYIHKCFTIKKVSQLVKVWSMIKYTVARALIITLTSRSYFSCLFQYILLYRNIQCILYLLLADCEVRTASYGPSFFSFRPKREARLP